MIDYIRWIDARLPHVIGADPDDGIGVDCLVMVHKVRTAAGLSMPSLDPQWFTMAAAGQWDQLEREWRHAMELCDIEPCALLLHRHAAGMGIGIVVDDGVLTVNHRRGVQWLPFSAAQRVMRLEYWRPRNAAI